MGRGYWSCALLPSEHNLSMYYIAFPSLLPQTAPPERMEADFQEKVAQEHRLAQFQVSRVEPVAMVSRREPVAMVSRVGACCHSEQGGNLLPW